MAIKKSDAKINDTYHLSVTDTPCEEILLTHSGYTSWTQEFLMQISLVFGCF